MERNIRCEGCDGAGKLLDLGMYRAPTCGSCAGHGWRLGMPKAPEPTPKDRTTCPIARASVMGRMMGGKL